MIKLIACDMDGTLLDEDGNLPEGTYDLILELAHAGIRFTAASGRRYDTLRSMFSPVADSMDFVASNGAQVYARGTLVDHEVFPCCGETAEMRRRHVRHAPSRVVR